MFEVRRGFHPLGPFTRGLARLDGPQHLFLILAVVNLAVAALCVLWMVLSEAPPILGLHPGAKPAKFGLSVALFLGAYAVLLPCLNTPARNRRRFANVVVVTMVIEILAIVVQALRGVPSHFNESTLLDYLVWSAMGVAIAVATVAIAWSAWIATRRPLLRGDGAPLSPGLTLAWRAGLWLLVFSAVSGAAMGGPKIPSASRGGWAP